MNALSAPNLGIGWRLVIGLLTGVAAAALLALALAGCSSSPLPVAPVPTPAPPLDSLKVSPDSVVITVGQNLTLTAAGFDTTGALVSEGFTWTSSDPVVATVDMNGRVTGKVEGGAFILAVGGGQRDSTFVVVTSVLRGWYAQNSGSTNFNLKGVFFRNDGRTGWAVGTGGRVIGTTNAGANWSAQNTPTTLNLEGVFFTSATTGWAVGAAGCVLKTTNGGGTWTRMLNVPASEVLNDVWFVSSSAGWIVGGAGVVLRTTNGGGTWDRVTPSLSQLNSVSFGNAADGWAVGDNGIILGTRDGGDIWYTVQPAVTGLSLRAVWRRSVALAYAAGISGIAPRTVAAADSADWELRNAGSSNLLDGICFPTDLIGFAVGTNATGSTLRSDDGGFSWSPQTNPSTWPLKDVFFVGPDHGWAVGDNGTVLHTTTGGAP